MAPPPTMGGGCSGEHKRTKRRLPGPIRRQAASQHGAGEQGQRKREEGQRQAPMVESALTLLPSLRRALESRDICEKTKAEIQRIANDAALCQSISAIVHCYEAEADKSEVRRDLADLLVSQFEAGDNQLKEVILKKYRPLWEEGGPDGDEHFERVLPPSRQADGRRALPRRSQAQEGKLLATHKGCEIREWFEGWDAGDGGIYVGKGDGQMTCSIFQEGFKDSLDPVNVGRALDGRPLYVLANEVELAQQLIDQFGVSSQQIVLSEQGCAEMVRASLKDCASVSLSGVVLKWLIMRRPGNLGNMLRLLPCCARKHFRQMPVELLPISLPDDTHEEKQCFRLLARHAQAASSDKEELFKNLELIARQAGEASWTWVIIGLVNYLFCGGPRPLGKVMPHPERHTQEKENIVSEFKRLVKLWVQDDLYPIELADWDHHAQTLGDMYTGYEVEKAYKLTWRAIEPHVPKEGEAGRINLADTVRPELKEYVENPDLLRIPDDELADVPMSAPVLVESDAEYDLIVHHLVRAGMFEKEVEIETLRVHGKPVHSGLFGVHKTWKIDDKGTPWRTLRLIVNLVPSNTCQRRMPLQPSKHMGYAPLWGSMCLLNDEVILCYGEDIRHCFQIFSPSARWRGYFVLSKAASAEAFGDPVRGQPCRPRVMSAPMGWSNIVDFVQSTLEEMGKLSCIPPERVVRLGEPSP